MHRVFHNICPRKKWLLIHFSFVDFIKAVLIRVRWQYLFAHAHKSCIRLHVIACPCSFNILISYKKENETTCSNKNKTSINSENTYKTETTNKNETSNKNETTRINDVAESERYLQWG